MRSARRLVMMGGFLLVLAAAAPASSATGPVIQSQVDFASALEAISVSPSLVMITLVNARTGVEAALCAPGPLLLGAILIERHRAVSPESLAEARRLANAATGHRFTFNDAALRNLAFDPVRGEEACRLIRGGHRAIMDDRSGRIYDGGTAASTLDAETNSA